MHELCVIRLFGYTVSIVWTDSEDLFIIDKELLDKDVISDEFGTIALVDNYGNHTDVCYH